MKNKNQWIWMLILVVCIVPLTTISSRAEESPYKLTIQNHKFEPQLLVVPANQKIKIHVENQDSTPEEFESYELNREKIIPGKGKIILFIGPLKPGEYKYFGEFHPDTAQGIILAQENMEGGQK